MMTIAQDAEQERMWRAQPQVFPRGPEKDSLEVRLWNRCIGADWANRWDEGERLRTQAGPGALAEQMRRWGR
jgi:hypothetical protein